MVWFSFISGWFSANIGLRQGLFQRSICGLLSVGLVFSWLGLRFIQVWFKVELGFRQGLCEGWFRVSVGFVLGFI